MVKWLLFLLTALSLSFGVEILSDELRTDKEGNIVAEGNVRADYREYLIEAQRIKYNPRAKEIFAYGNVHIRKKDGSFEVFGREAYLNLRTEKGYFIDAKGRFRKFFFAAERVDRVGRDRYVVHDGDVTTCPPEAKELKLCFWRAHISDKYVISLSNTMKFFNLPVAYSPLMVFPVGERRSGLLPPMIGGNTYNNFIYIQPFYWAISEDKDATLTFDYRDKQAKGVSLEFRQALSFRDRIFLKFSYYREPLPPGEWWEGRDMSTFREKRYRLELNVSYGEWKLGLDLPSDPYFFEDFYFSQRTRTTPFTVSYLTYTKLEREYLFSFNLRSYYDLSSPNNKQTLSLLPEFGFYTRPKKVGPAYINLTTTFTNFYREKGLRTKRLIFIPQAEIPLTFFNLRNYLGVSFLNNFYFTEGDDFEDDRVGTIYVEDRFPLFYDFSFRNFSFSNVLELVYSFSPENFDNPQFDSFDRVTKENNFKLRMNTNLSSKGRTFLNLFLEGGYNILGSYRFPTDSKIIEKKLLPLRFTITMFPTGWLSVSEYAIYDPNLSVLARSVSSANINILNLSLRASYVTSRNSSNKRITDQYSTGAEIRLRKLILGGYLTRDNITNRELYRKLYLGLRGPCWAVRADFRRTYYGSEKGYVREVFVVFNVFNLREFKLPLRRK